MGHAKYTLFLDSYLDHSGEKHYYLACDYHRQPSSKSHVEIHDLIIRQFLAEYYDVDSGIPQKELRSQQISGYTQYCKNRKVYRCHPNYMNGGPWYDFVVIPWQGYSPHHIEQQRRRKEKSKIRSTDHSEITSYLDEVYEVQGADEHSGEERCLVPACLMALYRHPLTNKDMAIVHSCRPRMIKNEERTSVLMESWHLYADKDNIYIKDDKGVETVQTKYVPMFHTIEADEIVDGVRVYMEDPRIQEYWPLHDSSGHVILLTLRSKHWAKQFLEHIYT